MLVRRIFLASLMIEIIALTLVRPASDYPTAKASSLGQTVGQVDSFNIGIILWVANQGSGDISRIYGVAAGGEYWQRCEPQPRIAFSSIRGGNGDIFVMDENGHNQIRLTSHSSSDRGPVWSHDRNRIAFHSLRDGNWEIYTMDSADTDNDGNGDNPTLLSSALSKSRCVSWSPDGKKMTFVTEVGDWEIYVMDAKDIAPNDQQGDNPVNLTNIAFSRISPPGPPMASGSRFGPTVSVIGKYTPWISRTGTLITTAITKST